MAERPFKLGELVMEPSSSTWVERISSHELETLGLEAGFEEKGLVGFRNHWTGVVQPLCRPCLSIAMVSGHLLPDTPVPLLCECRDVKPVGEEAKFYFEPSTTRGANYTDLSRNGGKDWSQLDWEYLVFQPIIKCSRERRLDLMLPFLGMLFHLLSPVDVRAVSIPEYILVGLSQDFGLHNEMEIVRFIRHGLGGGNAYITKEQSAEADLNLSRIAAKDLMSRLTVWSTFT
jgi:hypothetical protein